jgi:hypothetical protein
MGGLRRACVCDQEGRCLRFSRYSGKSVGYETCVHGNVRCPLSELAGWGRWAESVGDEDDFVLIYDEASDTHVLL